MRGSTSSRALGRRGLLASVIAAIGVLLAALLAVPAQAQEPARPAQNLVCSAFGGGPPYAFQTYEAARSRQPYMQAQRLAAANQLLPNDRTFRLPPIETGPPGNTTPNPGAAIPERLLNAIGWIESRLNQASISVPYGGIGPVLVSSSCAYGLMQVASFFTNNGDLPSRDEALAGTHYAYNVAMGAKILVEKWNLQFFPDVGNNEPNFMESWYYATWAYNGWAFSNHPAGAEVDPFRGTYDCNGSFNGYAYQELVWGCLRNPPQVDGVRLWDPVGVQFPNLTTLAASGGPLDPAHFFDGWAAVLGAPFGGAAPARPFAPMNMPLPNGATPVQAGGLDAASASTQRGALLGSPTMRVSQDSFELMVTEQRTDTATVTIANSGTGLLPFRVASAPPWLAVSAPAAVAVGSGQNLVAGADGSVRLTLTPDAEGLNEGLAQGTIILEGLLPDGTVLSRPLSVTLNKQGVPSYQAGTPRS